MLSEIRKTVTLALPIMAAQFLSIVMVFIDNVIVGRLGREALGGLALAGGFYTFIFVIIIGLVGALSPLVSQAHGSRNFKLAGHYTRQAVLLSILLSIGLIGCLAFAEPLLLMLGQQAAQSAMAGAYLKAMMWTVPAQLGFLIFRNFCEGTGDTIPSMLIALVIALLNIPLDYALVFGQWGFPEMGVAGAGYATASLNWLSLIALITYVSTRRRYRRYELFSMPLLPDKTAIKEFIALGLPLGGAVAMEMGFFTTTTFLMGHFGDLELAAHQVALNATSMIFMIPLGLSFAVSIRIGQLLGKGDRQGARRAWLASIIIVAVIQTVTASFFLLFPEKIVALYGQEGEVVAMAIQLLMIAGLFQFFDGFQVVGMGALRGLREANFALIATSLSFWVVGGSVVAYAYFHQAPRGIWLGLLAGLAVASVAHHTRAWFVFKNDKTLRPVTVNVTGTGTGNI